MTARLIENDVWDLLYRNVFQANFFAAKAKAKTSALLGQ